MSATAQEFALNDTDHTIAAADLPEMQRSYTEKAEHVENMLGVKMHYHFTDPELERFNALMIEWAPDDRLFLTQHAINVMQKLIAIAGDAAFVIDQVHEARNELDGIYEVV